MDPSRAHAFGVSIVLCAGFAVCEPCRSGSAWVSLAYAERGFDPAVSALSHASGQESTDASSEHPPLTPVQAYERRVAQEIAGLRNEPLQTTISKLSDIEGYRSPLMSDGASGIEMPLYPEKGCRDIEDIVSNRRFRKALQELSAMPKEQASGLIDSEIAAALRHYVPLFDGNWRVVADGRRKVPAGTPSSAGPSLQMSNNANGAPTFAGLRLKLFSLALIAANLRLYQSRPAIISLVREAYRERDRMYDRREGQEADRFLMLVQASLYNRQILATALERTAGATSNGRNATEEMPSRYWESRGLAAYDAGPFDARVMTNGRTSASTGSSGVSVVLIFRRPMGDNEFDALTRTYRKEIQSGRR